MTPDQESRMIAAHRAGRVYAAEVFAQAVREALTLFAGDHEAQFSFLAGLMGELRRATAKHPARRDSATPTQS